MPRRLASLLAHRWFFSGVVALGVVLTLPTLVTGFLADDYIFLNRLEHSPAPPNWGLYAFATGAPGQHATLMNSRWVAFPWWVADDFKVRFLRPLSSGVFALDHALFGQQPFGYHVHCLLWYALLLGAVGLLLRSICSSPLWQIAFALFAVSGSHAEAVGWISSRHMLVSTVPALLGLWALVRHREHGFRPGLVLGMLGMLLGLLGGEAALSVACYWLAYAALSAREARTWRARLACLAPPLLLCLAYAALYKALGYGVGASAAYLDPISTPRAFWPALPGRLAMLVGDLFLTLPSNLALTTLTGLGIALGVGCGVGVALVLRRIWPQIPVADRRTLTWLSAGAALSMIATAGAFLGPRLVLIPGIGGCVVVATLLQHGWRGRGVLANAAERWGCRALVVIFSLIHVVVAPFALLLNCYMLSDVGAATRDIEASLDQHFESHRASGGRPPAVFVLASSDPFAAFYAAAIRAVRRPGTTAQWKMLSMARATHHIERTALNQLTIQSQPSQLRSTFEGLFRPSEQAFLVGDRAALNDAFVTVLAVDAGRPTSISLTLTRGSLDDSDVCLLAWRDGHLVPVRLALHEALDIRWSPGPTGLL